MSEMQYPTDLVVSGNISPRPFSEIPGLWLKVTQMTEAFFAEEAPRASEGSTLVSILVYLAALVIGFPTSFRIWRSRRRKGIGARLPRLY